MGGIQANVTIPGILESEARSFPDLWWVAKDYTVESVRAGRELMRVLRPMVDGRPIRTPCGSGKGKRYFPMARPELPAEFAKIADQDEEAVIHFARRYGHLGYAEAFGFVECIGAASLKVHNPKIQGDPIPWILAHAKTVGLVLSLASLLDKPEALRTHLERLIVRGERPGNEGSYRHTMAYRGDTRIREGHMRAFDDPREAALNLMALSLNENLEGVSRVLVVERPKGRSRFRSFFSFNNLLDCIYWLAADGILRGRMRRCVHCGMPFFASDDRMLYCPPAEESRSRVSPCMNRAKVRRFRCSPRRKTSRKR